MTSLEVGSGFVNFEKKALRATFRLYVKIDEFKLHLGTWPLGENCDNINFSTLWVLIDEKLVKWRILMCILTLLAFCSLFFVLVVSIDSMVLASLYAWLWYQFWLKASIIAKVGYIGADMCSLILWFQETLQLSSIKFGVEPYRKWWHSVKIACALLGIQIQQMINSLDRCNLLFVMCCVFDVRCYNWRAAAESCI